MSYLISLILLKVALNTITPCIKPKLQEIIKFVSFFPIKTFVIENAKRITSQKCLEKETGLGRKAERKEEVIYEENT
jgi:hypothetical protein